MDDKDKIRYMNHPNRDVPPEAIIRQLLRQKGEMQSEIDELKDRLERKEKAITAFKEWQKKVAQYQIDYWINEGVKFLDVRPDPMILKKVRAVVQRNRVLAEWDRKVTKAYNATVKADKELFASASDINIEEIALIVFPKDIVKSPDGKGTDINKDLRKAWIEGVEYGRDRINVKKDEM